MKSKSLIITNILILVIVLIGLSVLLFLGLGREHDFIRESSELLNSKTFNKSEIEHFISDVKNFDLMIKESLDDQIKVLVYGSKKNKDSIDININNGELIIQQTKRKSSICIGFCFNHNEIVVYMPKDIMIDSDIKSVSGDVNLKNNFNNLKITTTSGDIELNDSTNADISAVSGDINGHNIKKGSISSTSGDITILELNDGKVATVSGEVEINNADTLEVKTTSGDVNINRINKLVKARTTSGDIKINSFTILDNSEITSTSGDVRINLNNDAYIDASSISGEKDIKPSNGENKLVLRTTSGDITVK